MPQVTKKTVVTTIFWRIIISAVGVALIAIAIVNLILFFFGKTAIVDVSTRRVGGVHTNRPASQRYEYSLDYTFVDAKGTKYNGHTTRYGSDLSVNTDKRVYYFTFAPFISSLEKEVEPNLSQPLFILIGVFLISVMNKKKNKSRKIRRLN